ncbi:MAG: carboxypeptidase M32 [Anaerovoracaceae bacterium]
MSYDTKLREFKELISKIEYLKYTSNALIYWDKITYMPEGGIDYRSKVMSFLADEQYKLMSGRSFTNYVNYFLGHKKNDEVTEAMLRRICRNSAYVSKIPEEEYRDYIELIAVSEQRWEQAKKKKDFNSFKPYLEKIFDSFRRFAEYWGYEENPYDALLGYYEENLTVCEMDRLAAQLKSFLIEFRKKIAEEGKAPKHITLPKSDGRIQEIVWKMILSEIGFSFKNGRVDVGSHPTILANSPSDVRIVNSYSSDDINTGIYNILHSGGKGIYQQSIDRNLLGTFLAEAPSFVTEEAIGRFYENVIGKSRGFWTYFHHKLEAIMPEIEDFTPQEIYESVNITEAGAVRLEADELTFLLHILIRYELEREVINGRLSVDELPEAWDAKYEEYLGIKPKDAGEGILQDIHWAAGYVGYFPTYFVSNLTAAQLAEAMDKEYAEYGGLEGIVSQGRFDLIKSWLTDKIFRHGALHSTESLLKNATGKELSAEPYIDYLRKKFSEVYRLNI